ncbi:chorismate mutase [Galliscardovia ingluviei]|uniref:prephenate dehydratase n=1 Tax=Galliscardovia ingluviei TaxID=1769422 RepID=A0A8J3AGU3_9BIFI|nr:chorismate mutase [Galliscardovia ingluviei]
MITAKQQTTSTTGDVSDTVPLYFLGPQGSFTHLAARRAVAALAQYHIHVQPQPVETAREIIEQVQTGHGLGIVAWDNTVEGVVVPNLDMLMDAQCAGFLRLSVPITFDAFVTPHTAQLLGDIPLAQVAHTVHAHPHGLAQCNAFIREHQLAAIASASNAAACRDIQDGQVALAPPICAELYDVVPAYQSVQDYDGARTDFLVLAPRTTAISSIARVREQGNSGGNTWESIVACAPLSTGPGVLANLLDTIRDAGLNMTSFMSRPIKGNAGTYSFIITMDAAPWEHSCKAVLQGMIEHGDWVKTLAVYPRGERPNPPVDAWMLPEGGVCSNPSQEGQQPQQQGVEHIVQRALLW